MKHEDKVKDVGRGRPKSEKHREVALGLLFAAEHTLATKGHTEITSREIADLAGTNQAMIRYYYDCKDGLLSTVVENALKAKSRRFDDFERDIGANDHCLMRDFISLLIQEFLGATPLYRMVSAELSNNESLIKSRYSGHAGKTFAQVCRILERFKTVGILKPCTDIRQAAFTLVCFIHSPIALSPILHEFRTTMVDLNSDAWADHVTNMMLLSYGTHAKDQD